MEVSAHPEVTFRVGLVRASLWRKPTLNPQDRSAYWVSLDRATTTPPWQTRSEELLDGADLTQAILALKKCHDYIKRRPSETPKKDFLNGDALISRLP